MSAKCAFHRLPIDDLVTGPPLRRPEHDGGPARTLRDVRRTSDARVALDGADLIEACVEQRREPVMHEHGVVPIHEVHRISMPAEHLIDVRIGRSAEHCGPADLVAVEVEDWEHRAVARWVEKTRTFP